MTFLGILCATSISFAITFSYKTVQQGLFALIFFMGFFISGLCNLINASIAADLGKQKALQSNPKALTTVAGIIDGSGIFGSAIGSLIIGATKKAWGWRDGFWLIISIDILMTSLPLMKILVQEMS